MKRRPALIGLAIAASLGLAGLTGCSNSDSDDSANAGPCKPVQLAQADTSASPTADTTNAADTPTAEPSTPDVSDKTYTIATAVYMDHPALQAVIDGFEDVLTEEGINFTTIDKNAQGDTANAQTIASTFASNPDIDLILAVSTPIATAMASTVKDRPILFSAVTDPVEDKLVPSWDEAGANITGTSDLNPEAHPVSLVCEAMPDVKTIGVLYSSSESNSAIQLKQYQEEAKEVGITIKPKAITSASEISAALEALAGVDAILIPTDNTIVGGIDQVISFGQDHQIPVFCADSTQVEAVGTVAARGPGYYEMGRTTGEMAVAILRDGESVSSIKPVAPTSTELLVNPEAAESFGLTLPDALVEQGTVVETAKAS